MTNVFIVAHYHREQNLQRVINPLGGQGVELFDVAKNLKGGLKQLMLKTFLSFEAQEKLQNLIDPIHKWRLIYFCSVIVQISLPSLALEYEFFSV